MADRDLEQHLAATPSIVGVELANQVFQYERQHRLGYYPAIDFFQQQGGVDKDLLNALQNISWVATSLVRDEIRTRLRSVFSNIQFETIQTLAFTLPAVRPSNPNALHELNNHYSATVVKVSLIATLIQKTQNTDSIENLAKNMVYRWLKEHFREIEVTSASVL